VNADGVLSPGAGRAVKSLGSCARRVAACLLFVSLPVPACASSAASRAPDAPDSALTLPALIRVGPGRAITKIADAARIARDGAVVLIEPGEYIGDVASWTQSDLTLRAVRCCARLIANGRSAEGKAIWVIKGSNVTVENIEFREARVADRNGAGIRHEGPGLLQVRNCRFAGNEMGILTWNDARAELVVERSEFDHNRVANGHRRGDAIGHQIYVGRIARFVLRDSYVHHGGFGHLVKSRARENHVYYNRLTDEAEGRASYEIEFPNGGLAFVVGNLIQQSPRTENAAMVSFGAEGYRWRRNSLYLINNTLSDGLSLGAPLLSVRQGADEIRVSNNLVLGTAGHSPPASGRLGGEARASGIDVPRASDHDYRLSATSPLAGTALDPGHLDGMPLRPEREYVHPRRSRIVDAAPYSPGAMQSLVPAARPPVAQ
jgi:hypothetical protein